MSTEKIYHLARKIRPDGAVSPWCAEKPRALNLAKELWTLRIEAATCPACIAAAKTFDSGSTAR